MRALQLGEVANRNTSYNLSAGSWIIVHSLESAAASTMNAKLGLICAGLIEGRIAVKVDGIDGKKSIKPSNLMLLPCKNESFPLVACLESREQWTCMRAISEIINESLNQSN
jgi:hypothetical protein